MECEYFQLFSIIFAQICISSTISSSSQFLCPEWCECLATKESYNDIKISCEWPHLPDQDRLRFLLPNENIVRLSIRCKKSIKSPSKIGISQLSKGLFSHLHKLRHLHIYNCPIHENRLTNGFFDGLIHLKSLHLENLMDRSKNYANLDDANFSAKNFTIEPGTLSNLKSLEKLTIVHNGLNHVVPKSDLCNLLELKLLNLSNNLISDMENDVINDQKKIDDQDDICPNNQIVILDLSNNRLSKIDRQNFRGFTSLRILRLNKNFLRAVPAKTFDHTPELRHLNLSENKLNKIDSLPPNLHILDVSNNDLHFLPELLANHNTLQYVNLSRNFIDSSTPFTFRASNPQLAHVDLSYNQLHQLTANLFHENYANSLEELNLNHNREISLRPKALRHLAKLNRLHLSHNNLHRVESNFFTGLTSLTHLSMENCAISKIDPDSFIPLTQTLVHLQLAQNFLIHLPKALNALTHLQDLNLSLNSITSLDRLTSLELKQLLTLDLSHNKLVVVERQTFQGMDRIRDIDLSHNAVAKLEAGCFDGASDSLTTLAMSHNLIQDINGVFANLHTLNTLNLSSNRMSHVDLALLPPNLRELDASQNQINSITNFLAGLRGPSSPNFLRRVDFSFNKLEKLTNDMVSTNVEYANFSHNFITTLEDHCLRNNSKLTTIDLSYNLLENFPPTSLQIISPTSSQVKLQVYLKSNPFSCECGFEWIKTISSGGNGNHMNGGNGNEVLSPDLGHQNSQVINVKIMDFDQLTCQTLRQKGQLRPIQQLAKHEFVCQYEVTCTKDCLCCEFHICDCKNACPRNCVCLADESMTTNEVICSRAFVSNIKQLTNTDGQVVTRGATATVYLSTENMLRTIPMYATVVQLDGNALYELKRNAFFGRYRLKQLHLNNSRVRLIHQKAFNGLNNLDWLDLSDNQLHVMSDQWFFNVPKLETLLLHGNRLRTLHMGDFGNLPNLKFLSLHGNRLKILPAVLNRPEMPIRSLTLSQNPWKCHCDDTYLFPQWLISHLALVNDSDQIYCYENLTESNSNNANANTSATNQSINAENATTILSALPPTDGLDVVKVNFWTFANEINRTFCLNNVKSGVGTLPEGEGDNNGVNEFDDPERPPSGTENAFLFLCVAVSAVLTIFLLLFALWRLRNHMANGHQQRIKRSSHGHNGVNSNSGATCYYDKYPTIAAVDLSIGGAASSSLTSTNLTPTTPMPLIEYDAFLSYSKLDEYFVTMEIVPKLMELTNRRFKLCLLYREFSSDVSPDRQHVDNELIDAMEKSRRIVTIYSQNFVKSEWEQVRIRTAYQWLSHCKCKKSVIVMLDDTPPVDHALAKYMRLNLCYRYWEKLFWDNFMNAMPPYMSHHYTLDHHNRGGHNEILMHSDNDILNNSVNGGASSNNKYDTINNDSSPYSDLYSSTTIVPSLLI